MSAGSPQPDNPWALLIDAMRDGYERSQASAATYAEAMAKATEALTKATAALTDAVGVIRSGAADAHKIDRNVERHTEIADRVKALERHADAGKVGKSDLVWKVAAAILLVLLSASVTLAVKGCETTARQPAPAGVVRGNP